MKPLHRESIRCASSRRRPALWARFVVAFVPLLLAGLWSTGAHAGGDSASGVKPRNSRPGHTTAAEKSRALALQRASASVVGLEIKALPDAPSNQTLGELRSGSGVVIGEDGLVLTIGYLILEADQVDLLLDSGKRIPARVLAMDVASGFGLVKSLLPLDIPAAPLARDTRAGAGEALLLVTGGADGAISTTRLSARQPYSGHWEYYIDHALFTRPARTDHSGAGLFNARGELLGIGSLLSFETPDEYEHGPGNLFVPVDLLSPIVGELRSRGSSTASRRAWLGVSCAQRPDGVQVLGVSADSPADEAGLQPGDLVRRVDGEAVDDLASFYKRLWNGGAPERDITLLVVREGQSVEVRVHSLDRQQALRRATGI